MPKDCQEVQHQISGYIDQEIEPAQANAISQHLGDCPGCAEEANAQKRTKEFVRQHAKHQVAPAHLYAQVRRALDRYSFSFSFWSQLRDLFQWQPIPTFATMLLLMLFFSLVTYYGVRVITNLGGNDVKFVHGHIEGEIICVDCELLDLTHAEYVHDATHRAGLRCQDGHIWAILQSEKARELLQQAGASGRHVRIEGHLFPRIQYVQVKDFSLI